jgi:hypothetical protein
MAVLDVRNVISRLETNPIRALIGGRLPCMTVDHFSRSATIKRGHAGAREPMFTVPTVPPQTLTTQSDREGAEARGTAHYASDRRPPTPNHDRHCHHVVLLIGSRYIYVIPRL